MVMVVKVGVVERGDAGHSHLLLLLLVVRRVDGVQVLALADARRGVVLRVGVDRGRVAAAATATAADVHRGERRAGAAMAAMAAHGRPYERRPCGQENGLSGGGVDGVGAAAANRSRVTARGAQAVVHTVH